MYHSQHNGLLIGIYKAQRPSSAAHKSMTVLKRRYGLNEARIEILTEGTKRLYVFNVKYQEVFDNFLGLRLRPVASLETNEIN